MAAGAIGLFFFLRRRRKRIPPPVPPKPPTIGRASTYTFNGTITAPPYELDNEVVSPSRRDTFKSNPTYELSEVGSPPLTHSELAKEEGLYELSEEASMRHKSMKSMRSLTGKRGRKGSGSNDQQRTKSLAELEAPSEAPSVSGRLSTPDSQGTTASWSTRQPGGGRVMPTPWL